MLSVMLLARRHVSQLVLDDREHLTHRVEDAPGELVLVIDGEPAAEHRGDLGFEDLGDLLAVEGLRVQHGEVLVGLRTISETAVVLRRQIHLHEDVLRIGRCSRSQKVIRGLRIVI